MSDKPETVKVKFNGVEYEFPKGWTILRAAKKAGIRIPHFCWHKHLSVSGNCRMCLVEVKPGPPKLQIACALPLAEGMEITTESPQITKARKAVLEFLLLNHPLDCPVCDEAYECKLQDYTYEYGPTTSRFIPFHAEKRVFVRENLGKLFVEMNRCIHCTRCVRFLKELGGQWELERMHRGHELKIHTYKKAFESDFAINAADLCPVGALEDGKFRFTVRNWDLRRTPTICPSCSIGCNIYLDWFENKIKRYLPRENDEVNACWLCDYGRHNWDFVHDNRFDKPHVRGEVDLAPTTYEAAFARVKADVARLQAAHGKESVALLMSSWMTNEDLFAGKKLAQLLGLKAGMLCGYNKRPVKPVMSGPLPEWLVSDDKSPNSTGGRLLKLAEGEEEFTFAHALLAAIEQGKIKGLILFHEDLAARSDLELAAVRKTLAMLDLLVVAAWRPTQVAAQAHVVLPSVTFAEKDGSFTTYRGRVQRLRKAIAPFPGVKSELEILVGLGRQFDPSFGWDLAKDAFAAMAAEEPAFAGMTWKDLGDKGVLART
ncbi:MAG: hypothetical protein C4523_21250 [Myxococcales bacterium]|nr:MAG: hypothetical protein C4523_21250 [Myxococcales bacterium]